MSEIILNDFEEFVVENFIFGVFEMNLNSCTIDLELSSEDMIILKNELPKFFNEKDFKFEIEREDFIRLQFNKPLNLFHDEVFLDEPYCFEEKLL